MATQEGTGQSNGFIVISQSPDVCKSPGAPIPYNIIAFLGESAFTSGNTNFQKFPVFSMGSRVTQCFGDLPGIGLGVASAAVGGWCRPITEVPTVICNGQKLCRHEHTLFHMNCLGPEGPGNTIGKVYYLGAMLCGPVAPGGKPGSQQNPPLKAETPKELSALDKIKDSLKVESIGDAVGLAKQAYALSQVDWSNPLAAVGALAGMAGRAGFKDISAALNMGVKAAKTDWSDPVSALKGAAGLAGDAIKLGNSLSETFNSPKADQSDPNAPLKKDADGRYTTKPDKLDSDGEHTFASGPEAARNRAAIEAAVNETGLAVVGGDHAGGASIVSPPFKDGFDHVFVAYKDGDDIKIAEMMPTGDGISRNFGSPNAENRNLEQVSQGYDSVSALPVDGLTPEQSQRFIDAMQQNTAPGNVYSVSDSSTLGGKGETCSTVIGTSLTQAGVPNRIDSKGDLNLVRPHQVLDEFSRINH